MKGLMCVFSVFVFSVVMVVFGPVAGNTKVPWRFKKIMETPLLSKTPFYLIAAGDLNRNGKKEVIATDFGTYGDGEGENKIYREKLDKKDFHKLNLFVLEFEKDSLALKWKKQWNMSEPVEDFDYDVVFGAKQFFFWEVGNRAILETIPPYMGLEWKDKQYQIYTQGRGTKNPVGSWAFPWLDPDCYAGDTYEPHAHPQKKSYECLVGLRDFLGIGKPRIISVLFEFNDNDRDQKNNRSNWGRSYSSKRFRVRGMEEGFPIEWESTPFKGSGGVAVVYGVIDDRLNWKSRRFRLRVETSLVPEGVPVFLEQASKGSGYQFTPNSGMKGMELDAYDLPGLYRRSTQKKGVEEYWGYWGVVPEPLWLGRATIKKDTGFTSEKVAFSPHKPFLGVGHFDLYDMDGDGLDEVILVEETGIREIRGVETLVFRNVKDYIRILKWNGKVYETMWVSPPYTRRRTKFLVEDIMNNGRKQLVVLSGTGHIEVWEKQ